MTRSWQLLASFSAVVGAVLAAPTSNSLTSTVGSTSTTTGSLSPTPMRRVGWTPENGGRGTFSLVVSCLVIIFSSTWVIIHIGVPPSGTSRWVILEKKMKFFLFCLLAPDYVGAMAFDQGHQARGLVKAVQHICNIKDFKIVHAFYIMMGGLRARDPDHSNKEILITPDRLVCLLRQGTVLWNSQGLKAETGPPDWAISEATIRDHSKADGFAKLFALVQVCWFLVQCISRWANHLTVSELEIVTLAYVFAAVVIYIIWWNKPRDIQVGTIFTLPNLTSEQRAELFQDNRSVVADFQPFEYNFDECSGEMESVIWIGLVLMSSAFGAIHMLSWNSVFPSHAELWLWRLSSALLVGLPFILGIQVPIWRHLQKKGGEDGWLVTCCYAVSILLYCVVRTILIVEMFVVLRSQPMGLYNTVPFANYIFHFG